LWRRGDFTTVNVINASVSVSNAGHSSSILGKRQMQTKCSICCAPVQISAHLFPQYARTFVDVNVSSRCPAIVATGRSGDSQSESIGR
jgi:hypothetical protein